MHRHTYGNLSLDHENVRSLNLKLIRLWIRERRKGNASCIEHVVNGDDAKIQKKRESENELEGSLEMLTVNQIRKAERKAGHGILLWNKTF